MLQDAILVFTNRMPACPERVPGNRIDGADSVSLLETEIESIEALVESGHWGSTPRATAA